jgi:3-oxoadipate enol-lactonase/4-carboxymuconolactone decarboxylase
MAFARNGDIRLHWREDGAGPPLLLLNSVGCDLTLWDAVLPHLKNFRVLRMDMRGHGQSDSPPGDYTLDQIAADAVCVLDAAGVDRAAVCGLSLGGMTAMTLALNARARVCRRSFLPALRHRWIAKSGIRASKLSAATAWRPSSMP